VLKSIRPVSYQVPRPGSARTFRMLCWRACPNVPAFQLRLQTELLRPVGQRPGVGFRRIAVTVDLLSILEKFQLKDFAWPIDQAKHLIDAAVARAAAELRWFQCVRTIPTPWHSWLNSSGCPPSPGDWARSTTRPSLAAGSGSRQRHRIPDRHLESRGFATSDNNR
jgi:hypothetical protein